MRLLRLPPPRRPSALFWADRIGPDSAAVPVRHQALADPATTDFPRRHLFDPKDGWFRKTERAVNKFLSREVFPRIPGARRPYASILERRLTVAEAEIPLAGLGGDGGLRVLVISDIHAGPFVSDEILRRTFARLLDLGPDLILLPGDFATITVEEVQGILPALQSLRAPLGVYGVLGNHDHYTNDTAALSRLLEEAGIALLQNRCIALEHHGSRLLLGGVDDLLGGRPDMQAAVEGRSSGAPTVVMSHNPDVFPDAVRHGVSLLVAGHTHGGQIRVPGLGVLVRMSRYRLDEGRFVVGGSQLVVSRGLGVTGLPLRFGCPPEALLLHLTSG